MSLRIHTCIHFAPISMDPWALPARHNSTNCECHCYCGCDFDCDCNCDCDQESTSLHSGNTHKRRVTHNRYRWMWMLIVSASHWLATRWACSHLRIDTCATVDWALHILQFILHYILQLHIFQLLEWNLALEILLRLGSVVGTASTALQYTTTQSIILHGHTPLIRASIHSSMIAPIHQLIYPPSINLQSHRLIHHIQPHKHPPTYPSIQLSFHPSILKPTSPSVYPSFRLPISTPLLFVSPWIDGGRIDFQLTAVHLQPK